MKALGETDIRILAVLKDYPQGVFLWQVQRFTDIKKKQYALYYMKKLIKKGLVEKRGRLYLLLSSPLVEGHKPITLYSKQKKQRTHAIQVNAGLHRTSADRAKATLEALAIPFEENRHLRQLNLSWKGTPLRFTTKKLIAYPGEKEAPRAIPIDSVKKAIAARLANTIEDFLSYTGLRAWRDSSGELILEFRYWENGYPQNEIAEESLKDKSRIVYSYSRETGLPSSWADSSLDPFKELENNSKRIDDEMKVYLQAIDDGELRPYEDELKTRKAIEILRNKEKLTSENVSGVVALIDRMQQENRDRDYLYNLINHHLLLKPKREADSFRQAG